MKKLVVAILLMLTFACKTQAIFLGTCEGYIKNATGQPVSGAVVNVSVIGCTTEGCNASTTSDVNGYYVVANLNLPAGGTVYVQAYHQPTSGSGSASGTADQFQAAFVNVTLCRAPSPPTLVPEPDTHTRNATLEWTSGTDPDGLPTHDRYQFDSNAVIENATSPIIETDIEWGSHTWKVQTCNPSCCSNWASDSFSVYNNPPSMPVLTDQQDTHNTTVILQWASGIDPDGDSVYDEYRFDDNPIIVNATSPRIESELGYGQHTWRVRTCDIYGECSAWAIDTFSIVNHPCPPPVLVPEPDTHEDAVTLEWISNATDVDGDPCHDRYKFDGKLIDPATSPQTETNLTWGKTYTWQVQSCDDKGACSAWQSDSFTVTNNPPSPPILEDQPNTDADGVALKWTSGTDPEGDPTYDQYQFDSNPIKNATSPQIEYLTGTAYHTWRVRTCDIYGECSAWVSDSFIRYECPPCECPECPPCKPKTIPGGYKVITVPQNVTVLECTENWICEDWSPCTLGGIQTRECLDLNHCGTTCNKPETWRKCTPPPLPRVEVPVFVAPPWAIPSLIANVVFLSIIIALVIRKVLKR